MRTRRSRCKPVSMDVGTVPGKVTTVKLDVSYDDGATWRKVTLAKGAHGYWKGSFRAPGGFVSVRAGAETASGYSVKNEIIRAYGMTLGSGLFPRPAAGGAYSRRCWVPGARSR